jgi:hypothetical protein
MKQLVSAQAKAAAAAAVLLFGLALFVLFRRDRDAAGFALWMTSPQLIPLTVFLLARSRWVALAAAIVLGLFWAAIAASWLAGSLAALFLPLLAYGLIAIGLAALWTVSAIYVLAAAAARLVRRSAPQAGTGGTAAQKMRKPSDTPAPTSGAPSERPALP